MLHYRPCALNCLLLGSSTLRLTKKWPLLSPTTLRRGPAKNTSRGLYQLLYDGTNYAELCLPSRSLETVLITQLLHCWCVNNLETADCVAQPFLHGANTQKHILSESQFMPLLCNICTVGFFPSNNRVSIPENEVASWETHVGIRHRAHEISLYISGLAEVTF
jgi:hypothetical protein